MDDVTWRYLELQRRLIEAGLDPDYVELALHKRAAEIEGETDLDSLGQVIVKETPERFRPSALGTEDREVERWSGLKTRAEEDQRRLAEQSRGRARSLDELRRRVTG